MSGRDRPHLSPLPGPYDEVVLRWLTEPEDVRSASVIEEALARAFKTRRSRQRPWDGIVDSLRPEPFGMNLRHLGLILVVAGLILAVAAAGLLGGGVHLGLGPVPTSTSTPSPSPSGSNQASLTTPTSKADFPLAGLPLEFVINDGNHQRASSTAGALSVIRADGTGRREIGSDIQDDLVWPDWVPHTDRILALQGTFSPTEQIWAVDATGLASSQVLIPCVAPCAARDEATVSHDGSKVAFFQAWGEVVNGVPKACSLAVYEFATQAITKLTDHACGPEEERHPRFSPDDQTLAFWRSNAAADPANDPNAGSAIFVRDLDTGQEHRVTDWTMAATQLDWSPDGRWIVFAPRVWDYGSADRDLWRIHADGTGLERLTRLDTSSSRLLRPLYTPDGEWILFVRQGPSDSVLLGIPSDGGEPVGVLPGIQVFEHDERVISLNRRQPPRTHWRRCVRKAADACG
jgi:hypothetical protein